MRELSDSIFHPLNLQAKQLLNSRCSSFIRILKSEMSFARLITQLAWFTVTFGVSAQDSLYNKPMNRTIKQYENSKVMNAAADTVFAFMDNVNNTGMHMTKSSGAMMGSKLKFEWISENKMGVGATYHWIGKVMGMKMDFTVRVSEWEKGKRKAWGTIGNARMIVIDWFQMYLVTTPGANGTCDTRLGIYYVKHRGLWGFLLGKWYSKWCVRNMLNDTQKHFRK